MTKDRRYKTVNNLISGGYVKTFREILETIPKSTIARDLGMHHQTFTKLIDHPERFTFQDAFRIAALLEVENMIVLTLIYEQYAVDKKVKKRK